MAQLFAAGILCASLLTTDAGPLHCTETAAAFASAFVVNAHTPGMQAQPAVVAGRDGVYIVAWRSDDQDGDRGGIYARALRADDSEVVAEFLVNVTTIGDQRDPSMAVTPDGAFVIVWTSVEDTGSRLIARTFGADAQPHTQEIPLADAVGPGSVAVDAAGNFVVTYRAGAAGIVAARFDAAGTAIGEPVVVTPAGEDEQRPAVASMPTSEFVVVWHDEVYSTPEPGSGGYYSRNSSVFVTPFDASGEPRLQQPASYRGNENFAPRSAADDRGFVVVWSSCYSVPGDYQARPCEYQHKAAQTFAADGTPSADALRVSGREQGYDRIGPSDAAFHRSGKFTVVWNGPTVSEDAHGVVARQFAPGGIAASSDVLLDEQGVDGTSLLGDVRVAGGPGDSALAVWERDGDILAAPVGPLELLCTEDRGCRWARTGEGRLRIRLATDETPALMKWVWLGAGSTRTCLVDDDLAPTTTASLEIDDASTRPSTFVRLDAPVCGTPPCWRYEGRSTVIYEDPTASQDGIDLVRFRVGPRGRSRLAVRASGPAMPSFELPLVLPVFVRFNGGPDTTPFRAFCSDARFEQAERNDPGHFLAVGAAPPP